MNDEETNTPMATQKASEPRGAARIYSGIFFIVMSILFVDMVVDIWPSVGVQSQICKQAQSLPLAEREPYLKTLRGESEVHCRYKDVPVTRVNLEGLRMYISIDQGLFALVAFFAALGGLIRSLLSVVRPTGEWSGAETSIGWNLMRPLVGVLLAYIVYIALRALLSPSGTLSSVNPYGYIAIAALTGLLCDEVLGWGRACGRLLRAKAG